MNNNKNHETVIKAIKGMNVYYIIVGDGDKRDCLQNLISELGMTDRIKLLGYRTDIKELFDASDVFILPSFREGLSVALMEAMACGKPCIVSSIRGNIDLIDCKGGALFNPFSSEQCKLVIKEMIAQDFIRKGYYNREKIRYFSTNKVVKQMKRIYNE